MVARVRDYMNSKLVYLREGERSALALRPILDFGITAVPVIDDEHRPVGLVSLRDIADWKQKEPRPTGRLVMIAVDASIATAAQAMSDADVHHLVVVDSEGHATGMLSALDVVRGLLGAAAKHPAAIENFDGQAS